MSGTDPGLVARACEVAGQLAERGVTMLELRMGEQPVRTLVTRQTDLPAVLLGEVRSGASLHAHGSLVVWWTGADFGLAPHEPPGR